jgi:uncharacterized repeat protein (TIGR01451 family)
VRISRLVLGVAAAAIGLAARPAAAATITVTSTADTILVDGTVTLREAITSINTGSNVNADVVASGGYGSNDTIAFSIPGSGVRVIAPITNLPALTRPVRIDGETQTTSQGNSNPGTLGTGGTVGATGVALTPVDAPEIEIRGNGGVAPGLAVQANDITIRNVAIWGFAAADIDIRQNSNAVTIENCVIGTPASSFTDPGAGARSPGPHIVVSGGGVNNGVIRHNLIGFAGGRGLDLRNGSTFTVSGNEIRGNGITEDGADGIDLAGSNSVNHTVQENLVADNGAFGIDITTSNSQLTIQRNTISGNGGRGLQTAGIGIGGPDKKILQNVITNNAGAGVLVTASGVRATISQNRISGNGTLGIDLLTGSDNQNTGTAPFVTLNDQNDGDGGGNDLLNFPVLEEARINAGSLQISGWARPGSAIELFIADADPSGFGEGATYLVTRNEQSGDDQDTTMGAYGPGPINGVAQGSDNTNRFRFVIPLDQLPGVAAGTALTATATSANSTSEFSGRVVVAGATTLTLGGTVFEDANYGGGPGRSQGEAGGAGRPGATVELYDGGGTLLTSTLTGPTGTWSFTGLAPAAAYSVRVVNGTVTSSRPGGTTPGLFAVETYSADVSLGRTLPRTQPGGAVPGAQDSGPKGPGGMLSDAAIEQSVTRIVVPPGVTSVGGLDFGFNFDTIVNRNDAGQGSLRQFIVNANTLLNGGLDQADTLAAIPPGVEASIFAIASPAAGVLTIAPLSPLPAITGGATWIDGLTQPGTALNTSTAGTDAVQRIELNGANAGAANGLAFVGASNTLVRAVVINRFAGAGISVTGGIGARVEGVYAGTDVSGTVDLGNGGDGVRITGGATGGTVGGTAVATRNIIAFNARGVVVGASAADAATTGHTIRGNITFSNDAVGIDLGGDGVTPNDEGDVDTGPNGLLNFPVITAVTQTLGSLIVEGFARPGSTIELFTAALDPTGFGEGRTLVATMVEGAVNDLDARTGSYGPVVGGVTVGSDTTNRFRFAVPLTLAEGALVTATATLASSTSEFGPNAAVAYPADVSIGITAPAMVQPGTTIAYVVTVTNLGPGVATGVSAGLALPAGLTWQSTTGACATPPPCAIASLSSGIPATFTATYLVAAGYTTPNPIPAVAAVSSASPDPQPANNLRSAFTLLPSADLFISKTERFARTGSDPLTYRITVINLGQDDALNVQVLDPTPPGVTFVSTSGACTTPFPCQLGTLGSQATAVIDVTYSVPFGLTTPVVNTASVTSTTPDPNPSNNTATASSPRNANLSVTKSGPASTSPGETITFTIVVTNGGPQGIDTVTVADPTPPGLAFVSTSGACETAFPCVVGPLRAGQSATIQATYLVQATEPRTAVGNTVTVSSPTPDPNLDDNVATIVFDVATDPDDGDGDGMPDAAERCLGLDPTRNDAAEDPDGDGRTNAQELADRTHPRGFAQHFLPEGSDNAFFLARVSLLNPDVAQTAHVLLRMQPEGAREVQACFPLGPGETTVLDPSRPTALRAGGSAGLSFATQFESDLPLVAERAMTWQGGGEHADVSTPQVADAWYFAEGATHGGFRMYYMLQNPGLEPSAVEITYLRQAPLAPFVQTYTLAPRSRTTIFANATPELAGTSLSAIVRVTGGSMIAAARAMYRDTGGVLLRAGTTVTGAAAPAASWYFAEGSVSTFFAEYLLILNPDVVPATVNVTFLSSIGAAPVVRQVVVPPTGRATVSIAELDPTLVGSSSAVRVTSADGVPVVVERSMWWPNDPASSAYWTEGHASMGATQTAPRWVFPAATLLTGSDMFLFLANHGDSAGTALIRLIFTNGVSTSRVVSLGPQARETLTVNQLVPDAVGQSFVVEVSSLGSPLPLAVERAIYRSDARGTWSSGSVTLGVPLP